MIENKNEEIRDLEKALSLVREGGHNGAGEHTADSVQGTFEGVVNGRLAEKKAEVGAEARTVGPEAKFNGIVCVVVVILALNNSTIRI